MKGWIVRHLTQPRRLAAYKEAVNTSARGVMYLEQGAVNESRVSVLGSIMVFLECLVGVPLPLYSFIRIVRKFRGQSYTSMFTSSTDSVQSLDFVLRDPTILLGAAGLPLVGVCAIA